MDSNYIPIDFDAYSVQDQQMILNKKEPLKDDDKVWRISSLTSFVDADTKILLLPQPESKRSVKIMDTKYKLAEVGDLVSMGEGVVESLTPKEEE